MFFCQIKLIEKLFKNYILTKIKLKLRIKLNVRHIYKKKNSINHFECGHNIVL
jgi:hypothetical protein